MKCKFKKYYSEAFKTSKKTLKNKENFIKYYVFAFMNLVSYLFFFIRPVYNLIQKRSLKYVNETNSIQITKSFEISDKPILYWKQVIAKLSKFLMLVGIGIIYIIITLLALLLGYSLYGLIGDNDLMFIIFLFAIPVVLCFVAYILIAKLFICPSEYILEKKTDIKNSSLLFLSIDVMKKNGKLVIFLNELIYLAINILYFALCAVVSIILIQTLDSNIAVALTALLILAFLVVYIIFFPTFTLTRSLVRYNLYSDVMKDCISKNSLVSGVQFKDLTKKKTDNELLLDLFEKSEEFNAFEKRVLSKMPLLDSEQKMLQEAVSKSDIEEEVYEEKIAEQDQVVVEVAQEEKAEEKIEPAQEEQKTEETLETVQEEKVEETLETVQEEKVEETLETVQEEKSEETLETVQEEQKIEETLESVQEEKTEETLETVQEERKTEETLETVQEEKTEETLETVQEEKVEEEMEEKQ